MQPAFLVLGLLPPPAAGAHVLARLDRARAGRAADAADSRDRAARCTERRARACTPRRRRSLQSASGLNFGKSVRGVEFLDGDVAARHRLRRGAGR